MIVNIVIMDTPAIIRKLDDVVINRIAAGEVIQRPANALKEMIENSLDAKATSIQIIVNGGGMKYLQIQDNGTGIRLADLEILCERFTTSKLSKFEDLSTIATYGFRGEALASISHVGHLSVTTKTVDANCAYRATYIDGKMQGTSKPCAGNQGTKIVVEDLFYNIPTRRLAMKSANEEFTRIADMISRYSIENHRVSFNLKKHGEVSSDISTPMGSTAKANIQILFGSAIAKELLEVSYEDPEYKFKLSGQITNPNYSAKRLEFILFINGRLVECTALKKMIDNVYTNYLPNHTSPFVFLSLDIPPRMVDVNVHPTKETVQFLHEQAILERVRKVVDDLLMSCQSSRTFTAQAIMPTNITIISKTAPSETRKSEKIRTDSSEQKLEKFFSVAKVPASTSVTTPNSPSLDRRVISLSSILEMKSEIESNCHTALKEVFKAHSFVGCVLKEKMSFIQYATKLYMCDMSRILEEFFYQLLTYDFGNFGVMRFTEPLSIEECALIALSNKDSGWEESHGPKDELAKVISGFLTKKAPMLLDYYSMEIDETGKIHTIPLVLERYVPSIVGLPMLMVRMATDVEWEDEKECFVTLNRELARFYAKQHIKKVADSEKQAKKDKTLEEEMGYPFVDKSEISPPLKEGEQEKSFRWLMQNVVFGALRTSFQPPKRMAEDGTVVEIANLHRLYQVFERC
ncbi:hypothetical protein B566_EDAN014480 [Ephemera danica]|nr:hypothetical protein B566_EDAN014480 [Ephemera danica]